jgi:hypothetical protein
MQNPENRYLHGKEIYWSAICLKKIRKMRQCSEPLQEHGLSFPFVVACADALFGFSFGLFHFYFLPYNTS